MGNGRALQSHFSSSYPASFLPSKVYPSSTAQFLPPVSTFGPATALPLTSEDIREEFAKTCSIAYSKIRKQRPTSSQARAKEHCQQSSTLKVRHDMTIQHADLGQQLRECNTILLPDSRRLGYAVYGVPQRQKPECPTTIQTGLTKVQNPFAEFDNVPTVIYCHGVPGCRLEAAPLHKHALNAGARIISIDRPGIGLSSPLPKRTILDFTDDEGYLLSYLGVVQYYILAYSAGAPYAYALGLSASHQTLNDGKTESQVLGIGIVAGLAPWQIAVKTLTLSQRFMSNLAYWFPGLVSYILEYNIARPARQGPSQPLIDIEDGTSSERDMFVTIMEDQIDSLDSYSRSILEDPENRSAFIRNMREAHRGSMKDLVIDIDLIISDWGFKLSDIAKIRQTRTDGSPLIEMWYGGRDKNVPLQQGELKKKEIEKGMSRRKVVELSVFPADTHFSILPERGEHILRSLTARKCV